MHIFLESIKNVFVQKRFTSILLLSFGGSFFCFPFNSLYVMSCYFKMSHYVTSSFHRDSRLILMYLIIISIFCILGMANIPLDHSPKLFSQKQTIYFAQNILTDHCSLPFRFHINSIQQMGFVTVDPSVSRSHCIKFQ